VDIVRLGKMNSKNNMEENTSHTKRNIGVVIDTENPAERAGIVLENWLEHAQHTPLLFLVSGGSSLEVVQNISPELLGSHVTIGVLDERFSTDPSVNNYMQLQETRFAEYATDAGVSWIGSVPREGESLGVCAARLDATLKGWREENPTGLVIALMGMGSDGHTAGIFPYPENEAEEYAALFEQSEWYIGHDVGDKHEYTLRMTVTNTFLKYEVDQALMYVSGDSKREMLAQVLDMYGARHEAPARIIHDMRNVTIVTNIGVEEGEDVSLVVNNE